eukprot:scaffold14974_cov195-Amphora_coffeaeformis.AAC.2
MPYRIIIPTNCIRRVSLPSPPQQRAPCACDEEGHSAMMLYSRNCESRLHSGRLMNMQGPGWPNSEAANRSDDTPRENVARTSTSSWHFHPRHHRHSEHVPRATAASAAFASPTISQIHRESFTSPRQTAQVEHARRRLETEDDRKRSSHDLDPLSNVATDANVWMGMGAASYDHDDPSLYLEDTTMDSAHRFDYFPHGIHDYPDSALDYHDRLFFPEFSEAPPLAQAREVAGPEEAPLEESVIDSPNDDSTDAPVEGARLIVRFPQLEATAAAVRSRRRTGRTLGRSNRRTDSAPTPSQRHNANHRTPSNFEMEQCTTKRSMEALKVWYQRYNELVDYREENGDCNVPQKYEPNTALGIWVNKMRMEKKRYDDDERSALNEEKIKALEAIDFTWAKQKGGALWDAKFRDLVKYKAENGHCNVPTKFTEDTSLGRWVSTQRKQYKEMMEGKRSLMTEERARKLTEIGFKWNAMDRDQGGLVVDL